MKMAKAAGVACSLAALVALLPIGCESPIDDELIESLGPEVEGLEEGPYHHYGQPCTACHGGYGPGPEFAFGGTVFATPNDDIPVAGAVITVTDATGARKAAPSNCAGNFYLLKESWDPVFPLRVEVECTLPSGEKRRSLMTTRINRDAGCAQCHEKGALTADSAGQVFCVLEQPDPPFELNQGCEGGPR